MSGVDTASASPAAQVPDQRGASGRATIPGFGTLAGVEWLRLRSRRAFWALVLVGFVGAVLSLVSLARDAQPPSAEEIAAAEVMAAQEAEQPYVADQLEQCRESQAEGDDTMFGPGFDCDDLVPRADWFYYQEFVDFAESVGDRLLQSAATLGLVAVLIGVTFAGADWSAGTIGTQLLFEPRRGRVFAAKVLVVGLAMAAVAALAAACVAAGVYLIASAWGTTEGTSAAAGDLVLMALRGVVAVGVAGAIGVALGLAIRQSVAVLGLMAAYFFVGEGLLRGLSQGAEPWLGSVRLIAWLQGGYDLETYPESCNVGPCEPIRTHVSMAGGGLVLGAVALALLIASYVVFRRRDVA